MTDFLNIYNQSCYGLQQLENQSIDAFITDPPYGIGYQNNDWDKPKEEDVPKPEIWKDCFRVLKEGGYGLVFSFPRVMHRVMKNLEESGLVIQDVLMWCYLNGMPKTQNIGLEIDKILGEESELVGNYKYVQGYKKNGAQTYRISSKEKRKPISELGKKYDGSGVNLKPAYEPIILVRKPNFENLPKIQYDDKCFFEAKVRQHAEDFNTHPTKKPIALMKKLVNLLSTENQSILDPFMGSGSTGIACLKMNRNFVGYELEKQYFEIAERRLKQFTKPML